MDEIEFIKRATQKIDQLVAGLQPAQLHDPTPATEWDVHDLLNHIIYETLWTPPLLAGKTIAEIGDRFDGDNLGDNPQRAWQNARAELLQALTKPDVLQQTVHLSYGDRAASAYLAEYGHDMLIHSWDLARGLKADDKLDPALVKIAYKAVKDQEADMKASGLFGDQVEPAANADLQTRLLAVYGRRV